jgi:hypothetical protein
MSNQSYAPPTGPRNQRNTTLIIVVVILVLCCCCLGVAATWYLWSYGDALLGISRLTPVALLT